jgi:hypothetical protein
MISLFLIALSLAPIALGVAITQARLASDCVSPAWMQQSTNLFPSQFQIIGTPSFNHDGKAVVRAAMIACMEIPPDSSFSQVTVAVNFKVAYYSTYKVGVVIAFMSLSESV